MTNRRNPFPAIAVAAGLAVGAQACASGGAAPGSTSSMGPTLAVEQFLQAANQQNLDGMSRMFGTGGGPIADEAGNPFSCFFKKIGSWIGLGDSCMKRTEIELRMNAIAMILQHDDYRIVSEGMVAGRERRTMRIGVNLTVGERQFPDVPFLVVQASGGRWLIEEIGLTEVTGR